jgi:flagellar M-ring protein FliF
VAVLVDGSYSKNDKGETAYQPRDKEEIDRIAALVRSAIGFDQKRGDQVEIVNLRFADVPTNTVPEPQGLLSFLQFTKDDVMHWVELLVMVLLGIVVLLLVVRPLVRRILAPEEAAPQAAIAAAIAEGNVQGAIAAGATVEEIKAVPSATAKMIDIAQVQGQVHAQSVQKVGELADKNPNETVSIIRTWLHESAA